MLGRSSAGYGLVGGVAILVYFALPRAGSLQAVLYLVIGASAVGAIVVGVRRHRARSPSGWYLLAGGLLAFVVGDAVWFSQALRGVAPYPSMGDVFYLSAYPLLAWGVLRLLRASPTPGDRGRLIEAGIITTGMALLGWEFLWEAIALDASLTPLQRAVSLAYPLGTLLLLAVAVRLGIGPRQPSVGVVLLITALAIQLSSDAIYARIAATGTYVAGGPLDAGWLISYVLLGAAALHPTVARPVLRTRTGAVSLGGGRLIFLAAAALVAPAMLAAHALTPAEEAILVYAAGSAVLFLLVLARTGLLVREAWANAEALGEALERLRETERHRRALLEETLRAGEAERARIAYDLHDGPIQRLTALGYRVDRLRRQLDRGSLTEAGQDALRIGDHLSEEIDGLRRLMSSLRPPALDERGLGGAFRDLLKSFEEATGIACRVEDGLGERPGPELETLLYRVAQEALRNVRQHARASTATVRIGEDDGSILLEVADDGVGFDVSRTDTMIGQGHFGLQSMREQVELAGGIWNVGSKPGAGTRLHATIPKTVP